MAAELIATAALIATGVSFWGWGCAAHRWSGVQRQAWPFTIAMGLATWVTLGGALIFLGIAYPLSLDLAVIVGLVLAVAEARRTTAAGSLRVLWTVPSAARPFLIARWTLLLLAALYALSVELKPDIYNPFDDLQKYFCHAARLVQTGTLRGSPLSSLGLESLGGQTLLHALILGNASIGYLKAADSVFCFVLLIAMSGSVDLKLGGNSGLSIVLMLAVAAINPHCVNIASVYSGAVLVLTIVVIGVGYGGTSELGRPRLMGLLYGALVAMKPIFAPYAALHWLFSTVAGVRSPSPRAAVGASLRTAGWGLAAIAPWIATYLPKYWQGLAHPVPALTDRPTPLPDSVDLLSLNTLSYGDSFAQYSAVAAVIVVSALAALWSNWKVGQSNEARHLTAAALAASGTYLVDVAAGPLTGGTEFAIRHAIPVLTGALPGVLGLGALLFEGGSPSAAPTRPRGLFLAAGVGVALSFLMGAWERFYLHDVSGATLSFLRNWGQEEWDLGRKTTAGVTSGATAAHLQSLQAHVPSGEPIVAWVVGASELDFRRNPILDVDPAGLAAPWAALPHAQYLLWQRQGFGVRSLSDYRARIAERGWHETLVQACGYRFTELLSQLVPGSRILADDGETVVVQLSAPLSALPRAHDWMQPAPGETPFR